MGIGLERIVARPRAAILSGLLLVQIVRNYVYDMRRYIVWSATGKQEVSQANLNALITMDYHRLEKGLATKDPRTGFGRDVVARLLSSVGEHVRKYGPNTVTEVAVNVLKAYYLFHLKRGVDDQDSVQKLREFENASPILENTICAGGTFELTRECILSRSKLDLVAFFESRHSIRDFTSDEVDMKLIYQAVAMAQKTPSVCNRQSSRVHAFSGGDAQSVLSLQNGNRGFREQVNKVLIVTSDITNFVSVGERNQCWIDGGMYAMSLVYALHSLGLGTCCLNWSVEWQVDQELKRITGITDSEAILVMIAVGHIPETLKITQSPRKTVGDVLIVDSVSSPANVSVLFPEPLSARWGRNYQRLRRRLSSANKTG